MRGTWLERFVLLTLAVFLLQACTLGGTGLGMAFSHPGQPPTVQTSSASTGTFTRERFLAEFSPNMGSPIWVTHGKGTLVTMGTYAGLAPDDGPKRSARRGARTVVLVPKAQGIRVKVDADVVVVPFDEITGLRLEVAHPPYWLIGTGVGIVVDIAAIVFLSTFDGSGLCC